MKKAARYRLKLKTISMLQRQEGGALAVIIPQGEVVEITQELANGGRTIQVQWDNQFYEVWISKSAAQKYNRFQN